MSQNAQVPFLFTVTSGDTLTITGARSVSVFTNGGTTTVVNSATQTMTLPDGVTLDVNADTGNTLSPIVITTAATAYVSMLGGNGVIS